MVQNKRTWDTHDKSHKEKNFQVQQGTLSGTDMGPCRILLLEHRKQHPNICHFPCGPEAAASRSLWSLSSCLSTYRSLKAQEAILWTSPIYLENKPPVRNIVAFFDLKGRSWGNIKYKVYLGQAWGLQPRSIDSNCSWIYTPISSS